MSDNIRPAAIVGMGPAGIAASIYLARSNVFPVCFEEKEIGGKLRVMKEIENYPGYFGEAKGLADDFEKQVEHFHIEVKKESVRSVAQNADGTFTLKTDKDSYIFQTVIIATGIREKPFKVPGSEAYFENGISRCAECDAPFHKNKPVAIIGNSSEAMKDTLYLASLCNPVYLLNEGSSFSADPALVKEVLTNPKVIYKENVKVVSSEGKRRLESLTLKHVDGKEEKIAVEGFFLFLGATPMADFLGYMDVLDEKGNIRVDDHMRTSVPGLFAVGDVRNAVLRQVVTAVSDGGVAAVSARSYLTSLHKKN
jgi:thioredoxin reductase (NADPH)